MQTISATVLLVGSSAAVAAERCSTVRGTYSIYANGDRLHISGSAHLLAVVVNPLDEKLEKAGWEKTAAVGEFRICYRRAVTPRQLTIQDAVRVEKFSRIRIVRD